jgi:hypothetical protein
MPDMPLDFYTTKQLFDELAKRFESFAFCGYIDRDDRNYALTFEFKGSAPEVIGVAYLLSSHVKTLVSASPEQED